MSDVLPSRERLRWQCRRGMLELDLVLHAYLERCYESLDDVGKRRFIDLLAIDDPTLNAWFFGGECPDEMAMTDLVRAIRESAAASR